MDAIKSAELKKTKMRLYRELTRSLADGSTATYSWQPGHNKDKVTVPMLQAAFGDKFAGS